MIRRWFPIAVAIAAGCRGESAPEPVDTGAKEVAIAWFTAMSSGNAAFARPLLDHESDQRTPLDSLARQAAAYQRRVGYPVDRVHVHACEENGEAAMVHVVLIGRGAGHSQRFQDAVALRRRDGKWGVVLSINRS